MKIVLACSVAPFSANGIPWFFQPLAAMFEQAGHDVEALPFPYLPDVPEILDQRIALRLTDVASASDLLITVGTPAFALQHPRKVVWLHDTDCRTETLSQTRAGRETIAAARRADTAALKEARHVFATCQELAIEWAASCNRMPEVLYPVLPPRACTLPENTSNTFLYVHSPGDDGCSRLRLAAESLRETKAPIRLVVTGTENMNAAHQTIANAGADGRVDMVTVEPDGDLLSGCIGVLYLPREERCYSAAFAKAVAASKCVVTSIDAGAAAEVLTCDESAQVAPASANAIAAVMDRLFDDQVFASKSGERGHEILYGWKSGPDIILERLLS